jgi:hypothetical protein
MTHALVIGVSAYDHLPAPEGGPSDAPLDFGLVGATTPATGAFHFARWLRDRYRPKAPLATVRLLLSPSRRELGDVELATAAAEVSPARRSEVGAALLDWQDVCQGQPDGAAVLYISGHGVAQSRTDHSVLLQDFAADRRVMDYSVDIGRVHRGMAGPMFPQEQFYFVDACRIRPDAFTRYRYAGDGLGLLEEWDGQDRRAAPVYFSASPGDAAFGEPGRGTVFSQALLRCLEGAAVDDFADAQGRFRITATSLQQALEQQVAELAGGLGRRQDVVVGGQIRDAVLHYFEQPPELPVTIELRPQQATSLAVADLWDCRRDARVLEQRRFERNPMSWSVPVGLYSLDVTIDPASPPLQPKRGLPVAVTPRMLGPQRVVLT